MIYIEGKACWILIDLDASCTLGALAGQKVTSSAFFPPEMARRELGKRDNTPESEIEVVKASIEFEMWYIGLLLLREFRDVVHRSVSSLFKAVTLIYLQEQIDRPRHSVPA